MTKPKVPEKSQKQNKLATVHFTTFYPATNYTFTKRHPGIKNYVPSYSKWLSQKCQKKGQNQNKLAKVHFTTCYPSTNYAFKKAKCKTNLQQRVSLRITLPKIIPLQNGTKESKNIFPATQND